MPPNRKYRKSKRYNKHQKKAYNRKQRSYKNRQQLLSVKTVKSIAKEVMEDSPEVKYKQYNTYSQVIRHLGHPALWIPADIALPGIDHRPVVKKIFDNSSIAIGTSGIQRIGTQIYLKGFRIRAFIEQPVNCDVSRKGADWYSVTLMVVKGVKGTTPRLDQYTNGWTEDSAMKRKATNRPMLSPIWKKTYMFRPKCTLYNTQPGAVYTGNPGAIPALQTFNAPNTVNPLSSDAFQPTGSSSTQDSIIVNEFVKVGRKINMGNEQATGNPNPYYFIAFSKQPKLGVGNDQSYINDLNNSVHVGGDNMFNVRIGWTYAYLYTDA